MTPVNTTVFTGMMFWLLVASSFFLPFCIYVWLLAKQDISRTSVLMLGLVFVVIAGVDVYLLQSLAASAKLTPSLADDAVFVSEISLALYLLPGMFGGIGINIVSHVLIRHLVGAEKKYEAAHPDA